MAGRLLREPRLNSADGGRRCGPGGRTSAACTFLSVCAFAAAARLCRPLWMRQTVVQSAQFLPRIFVIEID